MSFKARRSCCHGPEDHLISGQTAVLFSIKRPSVKTILPERRGHVVLDQKTGIEGQEIMLIRPRKACFLVPEDQVFPGQTKSKERAVQRQGTVLSEIRRPYCPKR